MATTCSNCQAEVPTGSASCPSCGTSVSGGGGSTQQIKFNAAVLSKTDRTVGGASAVLFIALFLPWFSVSFAGVTATADGLSAHGYLYLVLIISLAIVAFMASKALGLLKLPDSMPMSKDQLLLIGTAINFVLVLIGFLLKPGGIGSGVGWSFGAFVGLAAAVIAAFPLGMPVIKARRGK